MNQVISRLKKRGGIWVSTALWGKSNQRRFTQNFFSFFLKLESSSSWIVKVKKKKVIIWWSDYHLLLSKLALNAVKLWVFISHVSDWAKQKPKKITHPHFSGHLHLTGGSGLIELRVSQYKTGVKESQGKSWPMSLMCVQYWAVVRNMIHGYVFRPKKVIKNNYGLRLFDLMEKIHANPILLYVLWSSELNALWNEINGVTHSRATSICWDCGACGFRGLLFPLRRLGSIALM